MYLRPFKNEYREHDFKLIADTIGKYFAVNKARRPTSKTIAKSPGFKRIDKIVDKEFVNQKAYREKWGKLTSHLEQVFKTSVYGRPDLPGGGFFGEVIIEVDKKPDFIRQKSLKFYVSILGPFFAIHGVDSSTALLEMETLPAQNFKAYFDAIHAVTISPVFEYQELFRKLEDELRSFFPGYRFVPYTIGMSTIKNISVVVEFRERRPIDTIYEGLFGTGAVYDCRERGDRYYGMKDWVKPLNKREKSLIDVVSKHIADAEDETTIHKVWKLQEWKRLEGFETVIMLGGMDDFDVVDLTDKSNCIVISNERGAPWGGKYKIRNEVIDFGTNVMLRIVEVSKSTLTLILVFSKKRGGRGDDQVELRFAPLKNS
ncbi:hypothetical protein WBG78_30385 [Chryseolinea sp. T2]|uniref:hypothetical protein n=1 Tax=Chryseolinea sp. T2 TaxID=3129255 RepID=UPI00307736D2